MKKSKQYARYLSNLCREHAIAADVAGENPLGRYSTRQLTFSGPWYTMPKSTVFTLLPFHGRKDQIIALDPNTRTSQIKWQRHDYVTTFYTLPNGTLIQVDTLSMMDDRRCA